MRSILVIDCCIRGEKSRTKKLLDAFLAALPQADQVTILSPEQEGMMPFGASSLARRDALLSRGETNHPRFRYAHQLAGADEVIIAAPFWDLSFPAYLKIYIENVSVSGITFGTGENGLIGLCRAKNLVFLTTRGGVYEGDAMEMGSRYLDALHTFFGIGRYCCIAADGLDTRPEEADKALEEAMKKAAALARQLD